jgi:hypothetical protein
MFSDNIVRGMQLTSKIPLKGILVQNHSKLPPFQKRICNSFLTSIFLDLTL